MAVTAPALLEALADIVDREHLIDDAAALDGAALLDRLLDELLHETR